MQITKGIIPAAGLGTRLLPFTDQVPKELFPLGRKLVIDYALEEAVRSGIEEVCIVISAQKRQIRERYTRGYERLHKEVGELINFVHICFVEQKEPLGLGDAIWTARKFVGDQPFAVLLPDNVFRAELPAIGQLVQLFSEHPTCCVGMLAVPKNQAIFFTSAGKLVYDELPHNTYRIREISADNGEPVREGEICGIGRYILTSSFFDYCPRARERVSEELRETDVLREYLRDGHQFFGRLIEAQRFDTGTWEGYSKAFVEFIDQGV
jgi:UTP--glucose-1-phosphate uridylyltransferase